MSDYDALDAWIDGRPLPERGAPAAEEPSNVVHLDPVRAQGYAATALQRECAEVAATPEGGRNHRLNTAAFNLGTLVATGALDEQAAREALSAAGRTAGLAPREIAATVASGLRGGAQHPRQIPESTIDVPVVIEVNDLDEAETDTFWSARPVLAHLYAAARARRASPWAVLGVALARAATSVPPSVVLPAFVGGYASLNLFVGLVGPSGSGKGAAAHVAAEALTFGDPITTQKTGSGEGIAHAYMRRDRKGVLEQHATAVLFDVPEIDTLTALGSRQGATLMPELRSAWSGERLGFGYADPTKRLPVPEHKYRLCLVSGIQPHRAGGLLDDEDGGTPQRFVWVPSTDREAPDRAPEWPGTLAVDAPAWGSLSQQRVYVGSLGLIVLDVCAEAAELIDQARLARLRGDGDALDGHALLARLKVAAALAILDGRPEVDETDWWLSEMIQRKSDATRAGCQQALSSAAKQRNQAKAKAEGERAVVVAETVEDAAVRRVARSITRKLRREGGEAMSNPLRTAISSPNRKYFETAVERLIEAGQITIEEVGNGRRITLSDGDV